MIGSSLSYGGMVNCNVCYYSGATMTDELTLVILFLAIFSLAGAFML